MPRLRMLTRESVRLGLIAGAIGWSLAGPSARADFDFNPNPTGGGTTVRARGLDWSPGGNMLLQGAVSALQNYTPGGPTQTIQAYYQAPLAGYIAASDPGAGTTMPPAGLNSSYQITVVASYTLDVMSVTRYPDNTVQFATLAPSQVQRDSFFRIYATSPGSTLTDPLNGTGYTAGTLIYSAVPTRTSGSIGILFARDNDTGTGPSIQPRIDQTTSTGSPPWATTSTATYNPGVLTIESRLLAQPDTKYFPNFDPRFTTMQTTGEWHTPFNLAPPSLNFSTISGGIFPSNVGGTNGVSGPDILLQTDTNSYPVPEPSSFVLAGIGLAASALAWRRRSR